ncbi:uncharacterized protein [Solanum tuberosum]|uniref:uncharacterized protein n=1 Tax=Solanum tuberosum TaxID=4113 RepID=UPI00073A0797|nr:PREDICTED: uncharacterized protein LOC107060732 [Solanum tuberosum]
MSNRAIKGILVKTINANQTDWSWKIDHILWAYRTAFNPPIALYKEKMKKCHDAKILHQEFKVGDLVLLYNSRLRLFPGKVKSKWSGPFKVNRVFSNGAMEVENEDGSMFKVNGQSFKLYFGENPNVTKIDVVLEFVLWKKGKWVKGLNTQ